MARLKRKIELDRTHAEAVRMKRTLDRSLKERALALKLSKAHRPIKDMTDTVDAYWDIRDKFLAAKRNRIPKR